MRIALRLLVAAASCIVPSRFREEWRAEWEAEIAAREASIRQWPAAGPARRVNLLRNVFGAFADAFWIQSSHWHSARFLARHWRLSLTAIASIGAATLAVVIGLGVTNALLLRPPGVGDPGRLLSVYVGPSSSPYGAASFPEFEDYRAGNHVFSDVTAFPQSIADVELSIGDSRQRAIAAEVFGNYFSVLGVVPALGSLALPADSGADADATIISFRLWQRLGARPEIVGSTIRLNSTPLNVLGVAPPTFGRMMLVWEPDVWTTLKTAERVTGAPASQLTDRRLRWLHMVGRLKPGVSAAEAAIDARLLSMRLAHDNPADTGRAAIVKPTTTIPASERPWVSRLAGALVIVVLLLFAAACANVTSLLLGLAIERRHEMLVRAALGASRYQLMAPALRESVALALMGGALGDAAGHAALTTLSALRPTLGPSGFPPPSVDVHPDLSVGLATAGIVIVSGLLMGLIAACRVVDDGISPAIGREREASSVRAGRTRGALVMLQMAIATLVLVGVGVSLRSLMNLQGTALGFSARNVAFWGVSFKAPNRLGPEFYARIRQRVATVPGIEAFSLADSIPLLGSSARDFVLADGETPAADGRGFETAYAIVDSQYFDTLGFRRVSGRTFDEHDLPDTPEVVVVSERFARQHWGGLNATGRRLHIERRNRVVQVIGVVSDTKYDDLEESPRPFIYFSLEQHQPTDLMAIARTRAQAGAVVGPVSAVLREFDPDNVSAQWVSGTLDDLMSLSLFVPRAIASTIGALGGLTLTLAIVGLYSAVFYSIGQRTHELRIRVALGAQRSDIFRLVLHYSTALALGGAATGLALGAAALPMISSLFYGIGNTEPLVLLAVAGVPVVVAVATALVAARPSMRLNPSEIVRGL